MADGFKVTLGRALRPIAKPFARFMGLLIIADLTALALAWFMTWAAPKTAQAGLVATESFVGVTYVSPWVPVFESYVYVATTCLVVCVVFFGWLYSGARKPKG